MHPLFKTQREKERDLDKNTHLELSINSTFRFVISTSVITYSAELDSNTVSQLYFDLSFFVHDEAKKKGHYGTFSILPTPSKYPSVIKV